MFQDAQNEVVVYYLAGTTFIIVLVTTIISYLFLHQKKVTSFRMQLHEEEMKKQNAVYAAMQEGEGKERNRIAEELHDGISAKLSGLNMNLDYLRSKMNDEGNYKLLNMTYNGVSDIINELRELSHNLKSADFSQKNLQNLLSDYIEQLNSKNECRYSLHIDTRSEYIDPTLEMHCYRIITELLYNVHKHAKATIASAQVIEERDKLELTIEDNGVGFSFYDSLSKGIGLTNVRNRVGVCKGFLNVDSSENGTTIIIELPLKDNL